MSDRQGHYLNYMFSDPDYVSDAEMREIVRLILEHLKLDAVRSYDGVGTGPTIELEPQN